MKKELTRRGVTDFTAMFIGDTEVTFLLYNLMGQIVGRQRYIPTGTKDHSDITSPLKYLTKGLSGTVLYFGAHSYSLNVDTVYIVEGVFDAIMLHQLGYCAFATLTNNPHKDFKRMLKALPQKKVVIMDNDNAGKKLAACGDVAYTVPIEGYDLNDMAMELSLNSVQKFIESL